MVWHTQAQYTYIPIECTATLYHRTPYSSPPSSQVPHSCSADSAYSVWHTIYGITSDCKHTLHNSFHFLFEVEDSLRIPIVHGPYNTPPYTCWCSVTSSSDSLWCVSTSYTNSRVKRHSHAHMHALCSNGVMCTLCSLNTQQTHFYCSYTCINYRLHPHCTS